MNRFKYFILRLFRKNNCYNCKFWIEVSPTWENPGGDELCSKHKSEWWGCKGCELKEVER